MRRRRGGKTTHLVPQTPPEEKRGGTWLKNATRATWYHQSKYVEVQTYTGVHKMTNILWVISWNLFNIIVFDFDPTSLNFILKESIDNQSPLIQEIVWRRTGDKPSPEPEMSQSTLAKYALHIISDLNKGYLEPSQSIKHKTWWRHQMETFSALLALCAGNSTVTGEFPSQRPVTRSCDVFFDLHLNKRLSKQSWRRYFHAHYDVTIMTTHHRSFGEEH